MKKTLLSAAMVTLAFSAQAQQNVGAQQVQINDGLQAPSISENVAKMQAASAVDTRWYSQIEFLDAEFGIGDDPALFNFMRVLPDSNVIRGQYSDGTTAYVIWHGIGNLLDPSQDDFEYLTDDNSYTVDSVALSFAYVRNLTDVNIVDTLKLTVVQGINSFASVVFGPGDTLVFQSMPYTPNADINVIGGISSNAVQEIVKIPLTQADTTSFARLQGFDISDYTVPAGGRVGLYAEFVPQNPYAFGDSLSEINYAAFVSYEEEEGASPTFVYEGLSQSYMLSGDTRYQTSTLGWNGDLTPSAAFTAGFANEYHDFWYKITTPNLGTEENVAIGVTMFPNPTTGVINVNSETETTTVRVHNMLGQEVVSSVETGNFSIDLTNNKAGIYFVTIENENGVATSKIVKK